jgi:hypothetical protein
MTRLEKCVIADEIGMKYDKETGKIYGISGKEIVGKLNGYININNRKVKHLSGHHFAWYKIYGNVDFNMLDHIDQDRSNNKIDNLRIATHQTNQHNRLKTTKGYYWNEKRKKYGVGIKINSKQIWGGYYETEEEAYKKYLELKQKYHYGK